jgi:putative oxidoreductase
MPTTHALNPNLLDLGLLVLRLGFGLAFAAHGAQKLFGWFGGPRLAGTAGFLESLGFRPGKMFAIVVALAEFVGGLLFALGFLGAVGPALMIADMVVAIFTVHLKNGFFVQNSGFEYPLTVAIAAVAIALSGPGRYSVDAALGVTAAENSLITWILLLLGLVGGLLSLLVRRPAPPAPSA